MYKLKLFLNKPITSYIYTSVTFAIWMIKIYPFLNFSTGLNLNKFMKKYCSLYLIIIFVFSFITSSILTLQAANDFHAYLLKGGHQGISCDKLLFTEKSLTVELWLNLDAGANTDKVNIASTMGDGKTGFILSIRQNTAHSNALEIRFLAKTPSQATIPLFLPMNEFVGKWGHMAFVISETEGKAYSYLNGELYETIDAAGGWIGNNTTTNLEIGNWWSDPKPHGGIADFRIWKTARTASEIKENFNKHLTGNNPGLYVNYTFSTYNRTVANEAGSGNPGLCNPESGWQNYFGIETLAKAPANISVNQNVLSWQGGNTVTADSGISGNYVMNIEPEAQKMYRNPLNGWVIYGNANVATDFWTKYDNMTVTGLNELVRVSDYATTLYIRCSWTSLNPTEDVYSWDADDKLKNLIAQAQLRGLKLAFRVVVDSRDKSSDFSPAYVKAAGAQGFTSGTNNARWTPYPDDPVFQEKYTKFLKAFAQKFNDPDVVEFVDGYGLGKWGEGHSMKYINSANRESVFKWIVDLYVSEFTKIPLVINYHRLIGAELEWGSADTKSETLLDYAVNKGFSLRHDAFGMTTYYGAWEKQYAAKWNFKRPIIMEGGWVTAQHDITKDPRNYQTIADVRVGEYDDSREAKVNMMDFRINETGSWFSDTYYLVNNFIADGAYRLYPDKLSLPKLVSNGSQIQITHRWNNLGWGYCPTNIPQWNQKYKVAFGLLDVNDNVIATFVDDQTDLSKWIKGTPVSYLFNPQINGISTGKYTWAVAIVDKSKNNEKGIDISVQKSMTASGWMKLFEVNVR
ncbi:MAG: hypothetical protein LLF95_08610 [Bacteroidales bacterium]|nr:hypothetical protein [Bacteroidales bacterium]